MLLDSFKWLAFLSIFYAPLCVASSLEWKPEGKKFAIIISLFCSEAVLNLLAKLYVYSFECTLSYAEVNMKSGCFLIKWLLFLKFLLYNLVKVHIIETLMASKIKNIDDTC